MMLYNVLKNNFLVSDLNNAFSAFRIALAARTASFSALISRRNLFRSSRSAPVADQGIGWRYGLIFYPL